MPFFIGLDWAATTHAVCVIDETGTARWRGTVPHSAAGLAELVQRVTRFGPPASLPVALERPSGLVVSHGSSPAPVDWVGAPRRAEGGEPGRATSRATTAGWPRRVEATAAPSDRRCPIL